MMKKRLEIYLKKVINMNLTDGEIIIYEQPDLY